jgi:hypothetical protein
MIWGSCKHTILEKCIVLLMIFSRLATLRVS